MNVFVYNNFWEFFFSLKKCNSFLTPLYEPLRLRIGAMDSNGNEYYLPAKNIYKSFINTELYAEAYDAFCITTNISSKSNDIVNYIKNIFNTRDGILHLIGLLNEIYLSTDFGKMNEALL